MAFQRPNVFPGFSEKLKYEDIIHNQIEKYREVRNEGDPVALRNVVEGLLDLITPNIEDNQFIEDLAELEEEWKTQKAKKDKEFKKKLAACAGGCPDVLEKPSTIPPKEHFAKMFMIANALLERKNLGLKVKTEAYD